MSTDTYHKGTRIGDISITLSSNSEADEDGYVVLVVDALHNKPLETLEYPDFTSADAEYNMLRSLLQRIAAIHPLVKT